MSQKIKEKTELLKKISLQHYSGLEEIDIGQVLFTTVVSASLKSETYNNRVLPIVSKGKYIIRLCWKIVTLRFRIEINGNGKQKIAFLFSNDYGARSDHLKRFHYVTDLIDNSIIFEPGKLKISLKYWKILFYLPQWYRNLMQVFEDNNQSEQCLIVLLEAYKYSKAIIDEIALHSGVNHISVFSDMHPTDNMVIQKCKKIGISTSTMQHGMFSDASVLNSYSDYFLGWGQQIEDCFNEAGICKNIVQTGFIKLIQEKASESIISNKTGRILVIFSTPKEDADVLKIAKRFSKRRGYKLWIKFHPGYIYKDMQCDEIIERTINTELSVDELTEYTDFALMGNTTVYVEYLLKLFPCFHYKTENSPFNKISFGLFEDEVDLEKEVDLFFKDKTYMEKQMKIIREYFTKTDHIEKNYKEFYSRFE